jgi:hypothetical protein
MVKEQRTVTKLPDRREIVRNEKDGSARCFQFNNASLTSLLKFGIPDRQYFVE